MELRCGSKASVCSVVKSEHDLLDVGDNRVCADVMPYKPLGSIPKPVEGMYDRFLSGATNTDSCVGI